MRADDEYDDDEEEFFDDGDHNPPAATLDDDDDNSCPHCGSRAKATGPAGRDVVCGGCGTVLEAESAVRVEREYDKDTLQSVGTWVGRGGRCRAPPLPPSLSQGARRVLLFAQRGGGGGGASGGSEPTQRSERDARRAVAAAAAGVGLGMHAGRVFASVMRPLLERQRLPHAERLWANSDYGRRVAGAAVYTWARRGGMPITLEEIARVLGCDVSDMWGALDRLLSALALTLPAWDPATLVERSVAVIFSEDSQQALRNFLQAESTADIAIDQQQQQQQHIQTPLGSSSPVPPPPRSLEELERTGPQSISDISSASASAAPAAASMPQPLPTPAAAPTSIDESVALAVAVAEAEKAKLPPIPDGLDKAEVTSISSKLMKLIAEQSWMVSGRRPLSVVGACIALAIEYCSKLPVWSGLPIVTPRLGIAPHTTRLRYDEICKRVVVIAKSILESNAPTQSTVHMYLAVVLIHLRELVGKDGKPIEPPELPPPRPRRSYAVKMEDTESSRDQKALESATRALRAVAGLRDTAVPSSFRRNERIRNKRREQIAACRALYDAMTAGQPQPPGICITDDLLLVQKAMLHEIPEDVILDASDEVLLEIISGRRSCGRSPLPAASEAPRPPSVATSPFAPPSASSLEPRLGPRRKCRKRRKKADEEEDEDYVEPSSFSPTSCAVASAKSKKAKKEEEADTDEGEPLGDDLDDEEVLGALRPPEEIETLERARSAVYEPERVVKARATPARAGSSASENGATPKKRPFGFRGRMLQSSRIDREKLSQLAMPLMPFSATSTPAATPGVGVAMPTPPVSLSAPAPAPYTPPAAEGQEEDDNDDEYGRAHGGVRRVHEEFLEGDYDMEQHMHKIRRQMREEGPNDDNIGPEVELSDEDQDEDQ